ncbi:hypothetical protein F4677DRAFT_399345 [Hypoxylon crocopeplum]|nr:hypothetical protein F4677DRAFT_399345 [Hypoxylon crocopeplum]
MRILAIALFLPWGIHGKVSTPQIFSSRGQYQLIFSYIDNSSVMCGRDTTCSIDVIGHTCTLNLNHCLANVKGSLVGSKDGNFGASCSSCSIPEYGNLTCECGVGDGVNSVNSSVLFFPPKGDDSPIESPIVFSNLNVPECYGYNGTWGPRSPY